MTDDSMFVTRRLQRIAEATVDENEATGDTLELEDLQFMPTVELQQLLESDVAEDDPDAQSDERD